MPRPYKAVHPGAGQDAEPELTRLATLTPFDYAREREATAKRLGVGLSTLDAEIKRRRTAGGDGKQGRPLDLADPDPWPEPVDGAATLTQVAWAIRRYVVAPAGAIDTFALWAAMTWLFDAFRIAPRLSLQSPEPGCGKSTVLDVLLWLVARGMLAASLTPAAVFRVVEQCKPTLLFDEAEILRGDGRDELRAILNMGHRAGGSVVRMVGDDHEPRQFNVFTPVAFASIDALPAATQDRCIVVSMRRKLAGESAERLTPECERGLRELAGKLRRFAADAREVVAAANPVLPDTMDNRRADNWRPLFAIADAAGGDWPERVRAAAAALAPPETGGETIRVRLLSAIRGIVEEHADKHGRIGSAELVRHLSDIEDGPWSDWRGQQLSANQLARQLAPFGIAPATHRFSAGSAKGYAVEQFADAFARYLPPLQPSQRNKAREMGKSCASESVTPARPVTDRKGDKSLKSDDCDDVTVAVGGVPAETETAL